MRICPRCARPRPHLTLVAVVYGRRYYSCGSGRCLETVRCKAEARRNGVECEKRGLVSIDTFGSNESPGVVLLLGKQIDRLGLGEAIAEGAANAIAPFDQLLAGVESLKAEIEKLRIGTRSP